MSSQNLNVTVITTPIQYLKYLAKRSVGGKVVKQVEELCERLFKLIRTSRDLSPTLINLYHDPIVIDRHLPNLDGLLAFSFYRATCSLVDTAVIPLPHIHVGEHVVFTHTDPIIRVEVGGETKYYIRCGYDICELDVSEWRVYRSSRLDLDNLKFEVYLRKSYDDSIYTTLKSISVFGIKSTVDIARGLLRKVFTKLSYYKFNISYVAFIPRRVSDLVKKMLLEVPIGKNTVVFDVELREVRNIKDLLDLFYVPIHGTQLYVLTKTIPKHALREDKVLLPIEAYVKPAFPYWKGRKKTVCYEQGTIVVEKVKFWRGE